jgi:hypothetical protein
VVTFEKCTFLQVGVPAIAYTAEAPAYPPLASLLVEASGRDRPTVILKECLFGGQGTGSAKEQNSPAPGGQVAVAINGAADLEATDCAFLPHDAFFHFRRRCTQSDTFVKLHHCSGFVVNGPAFSFERRASSRLQVEHSLFSRPDYVNRPFSGPDLIRQIDDSTTAIVYQGEANCYHNLNALWVKRDHIAALWDEFQKDVTAQPEGRDVQSLLLKKLLPMPWASSQPLLAETAEGTFRVNESYKNYGVQSCVWGKMTPAFEPAEKPPELPSGQSYKIVDAAGKGGPNVFRSLAAALADAVEGDIILLKHAPGRRELEISPAVLDARVKSVTLRPYPKHQPILTMERTIRKKDEALFSVPDGALTLEELHLVLEPEREGFTGRSLVQLGEGAHCTFKDCVVTLKPPRAAKRLPLHVVTFDDPERVMKMGQPNSGRAQLVMKNCFVRGEGDLIDMAGSRPFDVHLENTLVALTGTLLNVQAVDKEGAVDPGVQLTLTKVSAFLGEPTFALHSGPAGKGPAHVSVKAEACLFVALGERALVALETGDVMNEESVKKFVGWEGKKNCYVNFGKLFEHQPRSGGSDFPSMLDNVSWKKLFPESESRQVGLAFPALGPEVQRALWETRPEQFKPDDPEAETPFSYGAALELAPLLQSSPE